MRSACIFAATGLMAAAIVIGRWGMSGHMTAHMIAVAVAAPVLAMGVRGTAADPTGFSVVFANPLLMSVVELGVVWVWHLPGLRAAMGHDPLLGAVEMMSFLAAGTLLWSAVLAGAATARAAGIGALLLTSMHMTLLGALVGLSPRPLYPAMAHAVPAGLTALQDQQLAGVAMLLIGGASYLLGGLAVLGRLLRQEAGQA